jgi:hypothetical protein
MTFLLPKQVLDAHGRAGILRDCVNAYNARSGRNIRQLGMSRLQIPAELINDWFAPVVREIVGHVKNLLQVLYCPRLSMI